VNDGLGGGDEGEENAEGILSLCFFSSLPFLLLVSLGVGRFGGGWWSKVYSMVLLVAGWT